MNQVKNFSLFLLALFLLGSCTPQKKTHLPVSRSTELKEAVFAGGCFWCMEAPFEKLKGVKEVISGFSGGTLKNPSYAQVASGQTKHVESVLVQYDPNEISYNQLLDIFWKQIDPTDSNGQFVDRGPQYRPVIFYQTEDEKKLALKSKQKLAMNPTFIKKVDHKPITTEILPFQSFYPAQGKDSYHQDYYKNHSVKYWYYRGRSGRDSFLDHVWGKDRH
ncbi:MAG: peptide-methionine (S)-S-oxide reductase [Bdellovibrionaceae bacterium]|nr:peptide-methionine (S)-S-oxide reductase [Pseudobdellovibrionaceae bacterium]|tara:strand:+ start:1382 stop:2038 length:657 start_codon:yes stop_codon:yes gene_type:complete